jgi:hypothetical protein
MKEGGVWAEEPQEQREKGGEEKEVGNKEKENQVRRNETIFQLDKSIKLKRKRIRICNIFIIIA